MRDGISSTYLLREKYVAGGLAAAGTGAGDTASLFVGYSDDNLRWAYAPPLQDQRGVSQGQARSEAIENVRQAIAACLEARADRGMPLTVETQQVGVTI